MNSHANPNITIRAASVSDAAAMRDIYAYYVEHTALTWDCTPPSQEAFEAKVAHILERYPCLIAEDESGEVVGYAYASRFRPMEAYDWDVETTIYLQQGTYRTGLGRRMYTLLEDILHAQGFVKMIAVITHPVDDRSDLGSVPFHERMGFEHRGRIDDAGYKFGRWYGIVLMDKLLADPVDGAPEIRSFAEVREEFGL